MSVGAGEGAEAVALDGPRGRREGQWGLAWQHSEGACEGKGGMQGFGETAARAAVGGRGSECS